MIVLFVKELGNIVTFSSERIIDVGKIDGGLIVMDASVLVVGVVRRSSYIGMVFDFDHVSAPVVAGAVVVAIYISTELLQT